MRREDCSVYFVHLGLHQWGIRYFDEAYDMWCEGRTYQTRFAAREAARMHKEAQRGATRYTPPRRRDSCMA